MSLGQGCRQNMGSPFLFDRKAPFLSNKKHDYAHSRAAKLSLTRPRAARVCTKAHTFFIESFHLTADFGFVFLTEQEAFFHKFFYVILTVYFI